jgi:hypothetical protein
MGSNGIMFVSDVIKIRPPLFQLKRADQQT